MKQTGMHIVSALNILLGGLAFLMVLPGAYFWIGFVGAVLALILGTLAKKSPLKSKRICGIVGISLAVAGALVYVILMFAAGYRYVEIL